MTRVTCRLTAKNRDQLRNRTLGNRVWATFTYTFCSSYRWNRMHYGFGLSVRVCVCAHAAGWRHPRPACCRLIIMIYYASWQHKLKHTNIKSQQEMNKENKYSHTREITHKTINILQNYTYSTQQTQRSCY